MPAQLIDICFNFTHESFRKDEQALLQRAKAAGVSRMMVTGASIPESQEALALAQRFPEQLFATAGVHPHLAKDWDAQSAETIRRLAEDDKLLAIGECGLDYNRDFSPRDTQRAVLTAQLELAVESGLPVFLHERDAHDDFLRILQAFRPQLSKAVVHCFTGNQSQLEAYLALDLHIGITGWICDERRGHHLREFIHLIPDNRLMIETDAPYLVPRDLRPKPKGRRNEPAFLGHIAEAVAAARDQPLKQLLPRIQATTEQFFGLEKSVGYEKDAYCL